jgi:hypothetical protein
MPSEHVIVEFVLSREPFCSNSIATQRGAFVLSHRLMGFFVSIQVPTALEWPCTAAIDITGENSAHVDDRASIDRSSRHCL